MYLFANSYESQLFQDKNLKEILRDTSNGNKKWGFHYKSSGQSLGLRDMNCVTYRRSFPYTASHTNFFLEGFLFNKHSNSIPRAKKNCPVGSCKTPGPHFILLIEFQCRFVCILTSLQYSFSFICSS